jgi:hypothetical protein
MNVQIQDGMGNKIDPNMFYSIDPIYHGTP